MFLIFLSHVKLFSYLVDIVSDNAEVVDRMNEEHLPCDLNRSIEGDHDIA